MKPDDPACATGGANLPQAEESYRLLFEHNPHPMWVYDLDTLRFLAVNDAAIHHYGYSREDFLSMSITDIRPAEDIPALLETIARSPGKGLDTSGVWRHRKKDGRLIYVDIVSHPLPFHGRRGKLVLATDITERKRAEEALRQSEERYRRIIETTHEGIWMTDLSATTTFVNPQMARMLGLTPEAMVGRSAFEFVFEEDHAAVRQHFAEFLREPGGKQVQERLRHQDGSERWALVAASVFRDETGQPAGFLGMFTDITDRVGAEEALREIQRTLEFRVNERTAELQASNRALAESEEKFRRLFETISDATVVFDAETRRFMEANEAALRLYGYTREEFLRLTHRAITAEPEDSEAAIQLTLAGAAPHIPLRYHKKKDRTLFPVEISASTLTLKGRPMACGIIRDITARKQAEDVLRQREQELADFFAEAPLGLLWVGPDGGILRVNQAELELLGRTGDEVFRRHVSELHADPNTAMEVLAHVAGKQTVHNLRTRLRRKDGTLREVLIDTNGLWEQGRLVYSRWFTRDITRRVELEREILAISEREQRRLGHDLHDDLCQQLAGIEFLTQRLASDLARRAAPGTSPAREIARMVQRAMTQTRELARGLSPVRLEAEGLADALRELATGTRRVFRCDCRFLSHPPVPVHNHTVAIHLYRIAREAVGNALRHGKARRIEIRLSAKGHSVILTVNDNGRGIPPKLPTRTGMGLHIMRYRAEVIGGALEVEPRARGGTRVTCAVTDALLPPREASTR
jgi:two-component system CheB/CheR fusion protein